MSTSLDLLNAPSTLVISSVVNTNGQPVIFVTDDPDQNVLTITLTNNTGNTLTFPQTTSCYGPSPDRPADCCNLSLFWNGVLSREDGEHIMVDFPGWGATNSWSNGPNGIYLTFAPQYGTVTLDAGQSLMFTLTKLTSAGEGAPGGYISMSWWNVQTLADGSNSAFVSVQSATAAPTGNGNGGDDDPPAAAGWPPLKIGFTPDNLIVAGGNRSNATKLYITNTSLDTPLVPDGVDWGDDDPVFNFFLTVDDPTTQGTGALCSATQLQNVTLEPSSSTSPNWSPTFHSTAATPYWSLSPTSGNQQLLGTQQTSTAVFEIDSLVTNFEGGPALAYFQWQNIPGYVDGVRALELVKIEPVTISYFHVNNSGIVQLLISGGAQSVQLSWSVSNATKLWIDNCSYQTRTNFSSSFSITVSRATTFTLTAVNEDTGQVATATCSVTFDEPTVAHIVPSGCIMIWSGAYSSIPTGWVLCDGSNGTPNLRDRFVMGGDSNTTGSQYGGPDSHYHQVSVNAEFSGTTSLEGGHHHPIDFDCSNKFDPDGDSTPNYTYILGDPDGSQTTRSTHSVSDHMHSFSGTASQIANSGGVINYPDGDMRPRYFQLCYIMKI